MADSKTVKEMCSVYGKEHQLQRPHFAVPQHGLKISVLLHFPLAMEQASPLTRVPGFKRGSLSLSCTRMYLMICI